MISLMIWFILSRGRFVTITTQASTGKRYAMKNYCDPLILEVILKDVDNDIFIGEPDSTVDTR